MNAVPKIRSWKQLCSAVEEIGFLPLQECGVPGFSVQAWTDPERWNADGAENPWYWRYEIVKSRKVCYGKFFRGHIGFISREWFPEFISIRRTGGPLSAEAAALLEPFSAGGELSSFNLKMLTCINSSRELDRLLIELMMHGRLLISGFEHKKDRHGKKYGWPLGVYQTPEAYLGIGPASASVIGRPERFIERVLEYVPEVRPARIEKLICLTQQECRSSCAIPHKNLI